MKENGSLSYTVREAPVLHLIQNSSGFLIKKA